VSAKGAPHDGQDTVKTLRTIIWYKRACIRQTTRQLCVAIPTRQPLKKDVNRKCRYRTSLDLENTVLEINHVTNVTAVLSWSRPINTNKTKQHTPQFLVGVGRSTPGAIAEATNVETADHAYSACFGTPSFVCFTCSQPSIFESASHEPTLANRRFEFSCRQDNRQKPQGKGAAAEGSQTRACLSDARHFSSEVNPKAVGAGPSTPFAFAEATKQPTPPAAPAAAPPLSSA